MNVRNSTGRVGYRSPGRRRIADELAVHHVDEPKDPEYRKLLGVYVRATAKLNTLPPQAHGLKQMARAKQKLALSALKARFEAL